ncbi:MAG: hypothetical protein ACYCTY_05905 [Sulfuricella sp.]
MAFARQQIGVNPNEVAWEQVVTGAVAGAALGAGMIVGSAIGANAGNLSTMTLQRRYVSPTSNAVRQG